MIQTTPKTIYVNQQQLQRQREHRDEARKSIVPNPDPARVLARAWRIGKLATSPAAPSYTEGGSLQLQKTARTP
jgi:hypothetical protein